MGSTIELVIGWYLLGAALIMITFGVFTGWLAHQKRRDFAIWFALGTVFTAVALLTVGLAPPGERPQPRPSSE